MELTNNSTCPACGTAFKVIYYQRRAADEPPDKVVYCERCPLDTTRLSLDTSTVVSSPTKESSQVDTTAQIARTKRQEQKKDLLSFSSAFRKTGSVTCIKVEGNAAQRCYREVTSQGANPEHVIGLPVQITTENKFITSYYYFNSVLKKKVLVSNSSLVIAPLVTRKDMDVYEAVPSKKYDLDKYVLAYEYVLDTLPGCEVTILRVSHDNQKPYIFAVISNEDTLEEAKDKILLSTLERILVQYGTEPTLKAVISNIDLNILFDQSGRAYDYPFPPDTGYTYTWKPDGERYWYVKFGSIWLFSKRLLSGRIAGWTVCDKLQYTVKAGPILDVEVMIGFPPILIDVLATTGGNITRVSRTLDTVLNEFNFMVEVGSIDVPISVRDYYRSIDELLKTKDSLQYPTDGVVGIADGSMTIIKLKGEKSIELELRENGDLVSSDQYQVAVSDLQNTYSVGSIIEIRFTKDPDSQELNINSTILRTDKIKANDYSVCKSILNTTFDTPNSLAMRKAVIWCNSIRQRLNQIASKVLGKGRVILDIGAGDGQSVSGYSTNPEVTYILLEPNIKKCRSMMRRLQENKKGNSRLFLEASSIINAAGLVSTGKLKYAVVCATLKDIIQQPHCIRTLKSCIRSCIASFSISYIAPELQELSLSGINIIGCGYMYDYADKDGILINEYGVLMKYTNPNDMKNNKEAVVIWGSDKPYVETAITLSDFKDAFYYKLAKTVVPVIGDSNTSLLNTVSSNVYIISTSKYI